MQVAEGKEVEEYCDEEMEMERIILYLTRYEICKLFIIRCE
jgi:hypothetical protein